MLISELSFPHLQAEREARLTRELEQRRVVLERQASAGRVAKPEATGAALAWSTITSSIFHRTPRRTHEGIGS